MKSPKGANWPKAAAICARLIQIATVLTAMVILKLGFSEATFPTQETAIATIAGVIILAGWSLAAAVDRLVQLHANTPNDPQKIQKDS